MMKVPVVVTVLAVAALAAPAAVRSAPAPDRCATALGAVATGLICREAGQHGVVLGMASAQVEIEALAVAAAEGEARFRAYFHTDIPSYAVVLDFTDEARSSLQAAGFPVVLPWLSPEQKKSMQNAQIRRSVEQQTAGRGLSADQVEALVQRAIAQVNQQGAGGTAGSREGTVFTHELGHVLFFRSYWPDGWGVGGNPDGQYGGPAPDWLDETAAVLHEDESLTAARRTQFAAVYNDRTAGTSLEGMPRDTLLDLPKFLTREHPVNRRARAAAQLARERGEMSSGGGVLQLSGAEARALAQDGILFYLQSRLFADFMLQQTNEPRVFHAIAEVIAGGGDFEGWLKENGRGMRLAADIPGLHAQWLTWLEETVGADSSAP